jgi:chromosome segregation ATPase
MREQDQLREQVATSTAALEALERERQQAAADCAALRSRCDQLRTELEARDQHIAALLAEKSGAESTASALQAQLADATSHCATLEQDMQDLRYGFSAVATEKDARIERQDGVLGDLTRQRDALQAELARLQQSE